MMELTLKDVVRTFKSVARHGSLANFKTKKKSNIISIIMMGILEFVSEERIYSMNKTVLTFTTLNKLNTAKKKK